MQSGSGVLWRFLSRNNKKIMKTIIVNKKQESELEQIFNELFYSLKKTYSDEDILKLTGKILKGSGKQTYNSKKNLTVNIFKKAGNISGKIYSSTITKFDDYQNNGIRNVLNKDLKFTQSFLKQSPEKIKNFAINIKDKSLAFKNDFLDKRKDEKIEILSVGLMSLLIFFASAGGEDFEGGIPDSDLNLGIGFHRHVLSHSIITGLIIEILMRVGIEIINKTYKNLPEEHHIFWENANKYINKYQGVAIGSMWLGISAHLIKDSGILGHGFKPYTGIPIELSHGTHQGLFAANGTASAIFSSAKI